MHEKNQIDHIEVKWYLLVRACYICLLLQTTGSICIVYNNKDKAINFLNMLTLLLCFFPLCASYTSFFSPFCTNVLPVSSVLDPAQLFSWHCPHYLSLLPPPSFNTCCYPLQVFCYPELYIPALSTILLFPNQWFAASTNKAIELHQLAHQRDLCGNVDYSKVSKFDS